MLMLAGLMVSPAWGWKPKPCDHPEVQRCCADPTMSKCRDKPWAEAVARCCTEPECPQEPAECPSPCDCPSLEDITATCQQVCKATCEATCPACPGCPQCPACPDPVIRLCEREVITGRVRCKVNKTDPAVRDCRARGVFWTKRVLGTCDD